MATSSNAAVRSPRLQSGVDTLREAKIKCEAEEARLSKTLGKLSRLQAKGKISGFWLQRRIDNTVIELREAKLASRKARMKYHAYLVGLSS